MKEHPILFTPANVLSILAEKKRQTRRVVNFKTAWTGGDHNCKYIGEVDSDMPDQDPSYRGIHQFDSMNGRVFEHIRCPYGAIGDRLWVREAFSWSPETGHLAYKADNIGFNPCVVPLTGKWQSPLFMPRERCRLVLEITDVRVERVQEISEEDCIAEGCPKEYLLGINWYKDLWDSINGKTHPWKRNPWCWCISFRRI